MNNRLKLFLLLCFPLGVSAQNLVPNSSFEEFSECPKGVTSSKADLQIPGWTSPTTGTPDHFHRCANGAVDVPFNICGTSNPNSGQGYAGIFVWSEPGDLGNFREYIQCELAEPLVRDRKYTMKFYFKLASYSVYSSGRIGALLTETELSISNNSVIDQVPTLSVVHDTLLNRPSGNWEEASMEYVAKGGEKFLTIGNFFNNEDTKSTKLPFKYGKSEHLSKSAYFFIDDVSLVPVDPATALSNTIGYDPGAIAPDISYALRNIRFEFDGAVLLQSSFDELDQIADYLKLNSSVRIRLYGHSFSNRSDKFNSDLSAERARSVAQYFVDKGVDTRRIVSYGYGKFRPVSMEMSEDARKLNNRIEIKFLY
jgi:outer membrane protein OmpA-like peptidoglycan-associated protein